MAFSASFFWRRGSPRVWPNARPRRRRGWEHGSGAWRGLTHATFYALLLIAVFSGWLRVSSAIIPIPTRFFDLFVIPNLVGPDGSLSDAASLLHYGVSRLLIGLIVLHVGAALKHHFFDRDDVLVRMLPTR